MSFLDQAKKPTAKPPMLTIVGSPGAGKTTLGAMFPNPIFIQSEDGSSVFESWDEDAQPTLLPALPKATETTSTRDTLTAQLRELVTADHGFKTLIIDSVTALNTMFESEICVRDGVSNVADASGGYHKGFIEIAQWHADLIYMCDVLRNKKGMAIVFLAHSGIEKVKARPDDASEYATYSLNMNRKSADLYVANCDAVLYVKKEELIMGAETDKKGRTTKYGRIMQTGERKIITTGDGLTGYVSAKNRYSMPAELEFPIGENPITPFIRFFQEK